MYLFQVQVWPKSNFLIPQPSFTKLDNNATLCQLIKNMYLFQVQVCSKSKFVISLPISTKFDTNPTLFQLIFNTYLFQVQACPKYNFLIPLPFNKFDTNLTLRQLYTPRGFRKCITVTCSVQLYFISTIFQPSSTPKLPIFQIFYSSTNLYQTWHQPSVQSPTILHLFS